MREFYFLNHVKSLIWVTLLALLVVWPASGAQAGSSCRDILGEGADLVGGVELTVEQARLFRVGPRGVLRLILRGDFTGEEKVALWRENVRVERLKGMFISDEVVFVSQEGLEVTAFIGLASRKVKALLFILEDGRTFLTHTSRELDQLMTSLGGGVHAELEGIVWDPNNATAELRAYLREALALARDPES